MNFTKRFFWGAILLLYTAFVIAAELPVDFPGIYVNQTGKTDTGYIFVNVSSKVEGVGNYIMILNNDGTPNKYKKLNSDYSYDFKVQPNGLLSCAKLLSYHSYTDGGNVIHIIMDKDLNVIDSLQLKNGYMADAHDFQILPNGHFLAFGYYLTQMDLSGLVEGGSPNALVNGGVIQEFDQDKNMVWHWRSWDHYIPDDYSWNNADGDTVATFLFNAISLDADGNILLGSSGSSKKINRETGEVIWDAGGDNNDFSFSNVDSTEGANDLTGNSFYRIKNGNFLIYNNATASGSSTSEIHEYQLNEKTLVATKVQTFSPEMNINTMYGGSAQRLPNGNTFVGWGKTSGDNIPACTEFDAEGNELYKLYFDNKEVTSYRAFRFEYPPANKYEGWYDVIGEEEYIFHDLATDSNMGITINIDYLNSVGYNELFVNSTEYAPVYPRFVSPAPIVLPQTIILDQEAINEIEGSISIDAKIFGITNPGDITIYQRDSVGCGTFHPLTTTYNPASGMISADFVYRIIVDGEDNDDINKPDEFIFTYPDVTPGVNTPLIAKPNEGLLSVYPNPSNGLITVKIEETLTETAQIDIFNTTGRKVTSFANQLLNVNSGIIELDLNYLSTGLYYIRLQAGNKTFTQKVSILK